MRRLFLHIGLHKTGSTSLQRALVRARSKLATRGIEFIATSSKGNSSGVVRSKRASGELQFVVTDALESLLKGSSLDVGILSGESLSYLHCIEEIDKVRQVCCRYFDETKVVVYLRRQDKQARSFKLQASRGVRAGKMDSSKLMGHDPGAFPTLTKAIFTYYDYHAKLKAWESAFGRDALILRNHEKHALKGGDTIQDFCSLLGDEVTVSGKRVNEAVSRMEFLLTNELIRGRVAPPDIEALKPFMRADKRVLRPSRATAKSFFDQFEESNRRLNDEYLPHESGVAFDDDFSSYPESGNEEVTAEDLEAWKARLLEAAPPDKRDVIHRALSRLGDTAVEES